MSNPSKSRPNKPRARSRSHRRGRRYDREFDRLLEDELLGDNGGDPRAFDAARPRDLSRDEQRVRDARTAAEDRAELLLDAGKMGVVVILLLIFLSPIGVVAFVFWCLKFGRRLFSMMIEPRLRERLVEEQVGRHIHADVSRERRELADEHSHSLEVLSASIAHEIRNPITAAKSLLQQMREDPDSVENEEYAQVALVELERVERSISHLLRFGREEELRKSPILMRDVLESALETFRDRSKRDGVEIQRSFDCDGALMGDAEKLRRVVINLVGNALDALADVATSEPTIDVSMGENFARNEVWVRIRDNGTGIDQRSREQIFTPFYTAKRNGTGLGLAITKKLVDAHKGTIEVTAEPGEGAEFVLTLPKHGAGTEAHEAPEEGGLS